MTHLVDTSAWMVYMRSAELDCLSGLIELGVVGLHDFTAGELALAGADLQRFSGLDRVSPAHHEVVLEAVLAHRPRRVGWIDAHLAVAARIGSLQLVTGDQPQASFARELGVRVVAVE